DTDRELAHGRRRRLLRLRRNRRTDGLGHRVADDDRDSVDAGHRARSRNPGRPRRGRRRRPAHCSPSSRGRSEAGRLTGERQYELRGVARFFRRGDAPIRAVDEVNLTIAAGDFAALEGPSGSGKTTLLQLLGALDRPSNGQVLFEGNDLASLGDHDLAELRLRAFGFVFQQFNLIPTLTAVENVEAGLAPMNVADADLRKRSLDL